MPFRVRGKEVQVLRPVGWRTLEVYGSRAVAKKQLMALLRSHAKLRPPPASPSPAPEKISKDFRDKPEEETSTDTLVEPNGPRGWQLVGGWHLMGVRHWVGLDSDSKPWVAWLV